MKMDKVAGSGNDEFYTPDYAVAPIMKYIPKIIHPGVDHHRSGDWQQKR